MWPQFFELMMYGYIHSLKLVYITITGTL